MRLKVTFIYCIMAILSTGVMLLVMTFNVGIFVTVVCGLTVGKALMPKVAPIGEQLGEFILTQAAYRPEPEKCCTAHTCN